MWIFLPAQRRFAQFLCRDIDNPAVPWYNNKSSVSRSARPRAAVFSAEPRKNDDTVLIFAHGGSISCLLGHFLNTSAVHFCCFFRIRCTGICEVQFKGEPGDFVSPAIYSVSDASHMEEIKYTEPDN